jgi:hypothetical protein
VFCVYFSAIFWFLHAFVREFSGSVRSASYIPDGWGDADALFSLFLCPALEGERELVDGETRTKAVIENGGNETRREGDAP